MEGGAAARSSLDFVEEHFVDRQLLCNHLLHLNAEAKRSEQFNECFRDAFERSLKEQLGF